MSKLRKAQESCNLNPLLEYLNGAGIDPAAFIDFLNDAVQVNREVQNLKQDTLSTDQWIHSETQLTKIELLALRLSSEILHNDM